MATSPVAAPALARGFVLLEDLSSAGPRSLEHLALRHHWPKTSVLRLLLTLEGLGAVMREPTSKRWQAVKRLVPDDRDASERARLAALLARLAGDTGGTAEFWVLDGSHLVLAARHEPDIGEVTVRARLGFRRDLLEMEATTIIACATASTHPPSGSWVWRNGKRTPVPRAELRGRLAAAAQSGIAWDAEPNPHGVVRVASPWRTAGRLHGIVAVALADPSWTGTPSDATVAALHRAIA